MSDYLERRGQSPGVKTEEDVRFLHRLIDAHGSVRHARSVAMRHGEAADAEWRRLEEVLPDSAHARFLGWLKDYVVRRER
jgi:hypothetical protein